MCIRNCSEYFANSGFKENDYHILRMKMPQFTLGIIFYFLETFRNAAVCKQQQKTKNKHTVFSLNIFLFFEKELLTRMPDSIVIIDHPTIVFKRPNIQKNAMAQGYQKENKWLFIKLK